MTTRRSFLTMLGLSPVVAAVPAVAAKEPSRIRMRASDLAPESIIEFTDDGKFVIRAAKFKVSS